MFQEIRKGTKLMRREPLFDLWILLITLILVMIGLIMVFSTSSILAQERYDDAYYFIKKQIIYVVLGLGLLVTLMNIDYHSFKKPVYLLLGIAFILLILVLIPGIGVRVAGARRWINIGIMRFQPAELLKLSLVIWLAYSLDKKGDLVKSFKFGVFPHLLVTGIFIFLLLMQPDFGTAAVLGLISVGLLFSAGVPWGYLVGLVVAALPAAYFMVFSVPYRRERILAFLNPWQDPGDRGFQIIQSFLAFYSGKFTGLGLGDGRQKLFFLPEAHTDFIFSVIGEEVGLLGVFAILVLFFLFAFRGLMVAINAKDQFGRFLAAGITLMISGQALLNIGIVLGLLPTKGLPLPFVSFGGSALVMSLAATGILLNISSQLEK